MSRFEGLLDVIFPPVCAACGALRTPGPAAFCEPCTQTLEPLPEPRCRSCSEPGEFPRSRCPRCVVVPPPFETAHAPFVHTGALSRAIHRFKYEVHPELARPLGRLLAREIAAWLAARPEASLCPLPLHRSRFRARKYDQAWLLCSELSKASARRLEPRALERIRATERQVGQDEAAREANVRGAFSAGPGAEGRHLILVDDVFTTGATARAAAAALLARGALRVEVLTLARAWTG